MQNIHETYSPWETSWEDSGRIEKANDTMGGSAAARLGRPALAPAGAPL